jgi:hypothetical protein
MRNGFNALKLQACNVQSAPSLHLSIAAPFLTSVDPRAESHYTIWEVPKTSGVMKYSPSSSFLEVHIPLSTNMAIRTAVSDLGSWSTFRLSKFYELVDALTGDVVYRHFAELPQGKVAWVTAGHYFSRKIKRTDIAVNVTMRSYITNVGRSSVEVRTDGIQNGEIINVCHTIMVALDHRTGRPIGGGGGGSGENENDIVLAALAMDDADPGQSSVSPLPKGTMPSANTVPSPQCSVE